MDIETIEESKDTYRFWDKQVFKDGSHIKERMVIFCKQRKLQRVQAAIYDRNDYFVKRIEGTPIINIVPESVSERFYKVICTKRLSASSNPKKSAREGKSSNERKNEFKSAQVITRRANIRGGASMDSEVLETVERGTTLQLVSDKPVGGWFEIRFTRTTTAWIHGNTIKFVNE